MSDDEAALLNAIEADRDADLPRLVYADWLEENGRDLRAEFIRIQCEIAKLEVGPRAVIDQNVHLWRRQQELLDGHREAILPSLPFVVLGDQNLQYRRGFLNQIRLNPNQLEYQGAVLRAMKPLPEYVDYEQIAPWSRFAPSLRTSMTNANTTFVA